MAQHTSMRFQPRHRMHVQVHSCILRACLAIYLIVAMQCVFVMEQPSTSLLYRHPRFQDLCKLLPIYRSSFWMAKYGAQSPKRTVLWGNTKGIKEFRTDKLSRKDLDRLPVRLARTNGKGYTGNKKELKQSQLLTSQFRHSMRHMCHNDTQCVTSIYKELSVRIWGQVCPGSQEAQS